jgi:hypothetical protein
MGHGPQIPQTPQTDERNFPYWKQNAPPGQSGHGYPKMLVKPCSKEDREAWLAKNKQIDPTTRQEFYVERVPRLRDPVPVEATQDVVDAGFAANVGEPVIVLDAENEEEVCALLNFEVYRSKDAPKGIPRVDELEAEIAELRAALKTKPKAALKAAPKKRRTRRTKAQMAADNAAIHDDTDED